MHHGCRHSVNDIDHPLLGQFKKKPTVAGMGYDGRYRCMECGRKVRVESDREGWASDWQQAPKAEPPYPPGFC